MININRMNNHFVHYLLGSVWNEDVFEDIVNSLLAYLVFGEINNLTIINLHNFHKNINLKESVPYVQAITRNNSKIIIEI